MTNRVLASMLGAACLLLPANDSRATPPAPNPNHQFCGGIADLPCPEGYTCVDDPRDGCDPEQGGADCGGICIRNRPCNYHDPRRHYVSTSPDECATLDYTCPEDQEPFSDHCGCGCWERRENCHRPDPDKVYVSRDVQECQWILFLCAAPLVAFYDDCGCGCMVP